MLYLFIPKFLQWLRLDQGWSQEPRTQCKNPMEVTGTQVLEPSNASSQVVQSQAAGINSHRPALSLSVPTQAPGFQMLAPTVFVCFILLTGWNPFTNPMLIETSWQPRAKPYLIMAIQHSSYLCFNKEFSHVGSSVLSACNFLLTQHLHLALASTRYWPWKMNLEVFPSP